MDTTRNKPSSLDLAQLLIDRTLELKKIKDDILQLKLEIYDDARGGIKCSGGRISFVDEGTSLMFDRARLKSQLVLQLGMSDEKAEEFINSCKVEKWRTAYIAVYLD